jgi:hypothetical protein
VSSTFPQVLRVTKFGGPTSVRVQQGQRKHYCKVSLDRKDIKKHHSWIPSCSTSAIELHCLDSILQRQGKLWCGNRRRHFIETCRFDVVAVAVHLQAKLPRFGVNDSPHAVSTTKRLVSLQAVPRVAGDSVVPPCAEFGQPGVLRLELESCDLRIWVSNLQM